MKRRKFFKMGAQTALLSAAGMNISMVPNSISGFVPKPKYDAPEILKSYTAIDHRQRLESIAFGERKVSSCVRKHLVTSYIPGHSVFAATDSIDKDDQELSKLHEIGIGIIQLWSGLSPHGKNYLLANDPEGFKRLVKQIQSHGLKVLPFTSSQHYERTDKNFKKEWAWPQSFDLVEWDYHLAHCSPASPDWRAYSIPRLLNVMDEYGVDGLYNDSGYIRPGGRTSYYQPEKELLKVAEDDVLAFKEGPKMDGAMGDFLALIYAEVKRRGGIYKLHVEGINTVYTDLKIYDYLWVGEACNDIDFVRESIKNYTPYVSPQRLRYLNPEKENESFINSIPYLQFPILGHGQRGEQGEKYMEVFKYWFNLYRPMVEEGTWVWIDIGTSDLFQSSFPKNAVASLFINREVYLVISNFNDKNIDIATKDNYASVINPNTHTQSNWNIGGRSMEILKLVKPAIE